MAELKTRKTKASVGAFMDSIGDPRQRIDCRKIAAMMRKATGSRARMWGTSIIGFGSYCYSNSAGRNFEWMLTGFSPRKRSISIYIMPGFRKFEPLLEKLGRHKTGKSCLYLKRLDDVDEEILQKLIGDSVKLMRKTYPTKK